MTITIYVESGHSSLHLSPPLFPSLELSQYSLKQSHLTSLPAKQMLCFLFLLKMSLSAYSPSICSPEFPLRDSLP